MGLARNILAVALHIYLVITLACPILILSVVWAFQLVNERLSLTLACMIQGSWLCNMVFLIEEFLGIQLQVHGAFPSAEPALVLANHLTHDWLAIYTMGFRNGMLPFVRTVIKKSASYIPFFGWGMTFCFWPFVSRDFKKDERVLGKLFQLYSRCKEPVQLWIFPEGTRLTPAKLASSQEYAKSKGYPVWKHVMLPRHRGFTTAVNALKGVVSVIYETTLQYEGWGGTAPSFWGIVTTNPAKRHVIHVHIRRIPISEVPEEDEAKQKWLMESFARREALIENFQRTKSFPGQNLAKKYKLSKILPHVILWNVIALVGFSFLI
jgi:1-acyl-sn-glycerol-3-phosphate acyltransferase